MRLLLTAGVVIGLGAVVHADPASKARADKLFDDGRRYLQNKEYALACTAFEQSQEADPAIGTQLNIALCYEQWGHLASAYRAYQGAEKLAQASLDDRAKQAQKKLGELGPKVPHLSIEVPEGSDPSAVFLFDEKIVEGKALANDLLVDAGSHTIEVRVAGQPPKVTNVVLKLGEHKQVKLDVPKPAAVVPPPPPPPVTAAPTSKRNFYLGLGLVSGGTLVVAVASYVSLLARSDYNEAIVDCPAGLCRTYHAYRTTQDARARANYMTVVGVAGLAMAGVGVYYLFIRGDEHPAAHAFAPLVTPDAVGVAYGGSL
jgi:tetratricopeptide (TPR) repeat protein